MKRSAGWLTWVALALITLGAGALRLIHIAQVPPDPFYDAAVRSMTLSWHNFFFGAFEPGGSVSIDKPPVDLWLQVASVKLVGFSNTSLKLPEALAGTLAVPLLFLAVRRMWSTRAGLAAAVAQAVLPIEVLTSRSDTMDGVMMALIVLALYLIVRANERGSSAWLLAGAAALGIAFDVKLLESLVALPGLAVLAYLGMPGSRKRRLLQLLAASAVYVVVALVWLGATLLFPAHDRPYAIGSTNGSAWNAAFVFNGTDRLAGKSIEPQTEYQPGHDYPTATQSERDHIPIVPASATRLLARIGPLSGERLGLELLLALLLGIPALIGGVLRRPSGSDHPSPAISVADADDVDGYRMRRALAAGLIVWLLTGIVLFSHMARLHPRYVEGLVPAVTATLGIGLAWATSSSGRARLIALIVGMVALVYYGERLLYGRPGSWWIALAGALGAVVFAVLARIRVRPSTRSSALLAGATLVLALLALAAIPVEVDKTAIANRVSDAGYIGALPGGQQRALSSYLTAHQGSARYELAAESATGIGSLIVQDARPVVVLTTYEARVFTTVAQLKQLIAERAVRYAFLNSYCGRYSTTNAACSAPALWIREHGTDVSIQAGLEHHKLLYLLPGAKQ
ncbi:MAG TPA: glycosyltransferase family 39 protein [Solirubrobacteraceae bacterium]|jgi:4-amino-4-deoxy-L-arabinose transferase-like glycosyltransferase